MAISVDTPKNLRHIKAKFIGNFTKRQTFSIAGAAAIGFPLYYATKGSLGNDIAAILMVLAMMPFLLFISDNLKYGLPAEKLLFLIWEHKRKPGIRPYKATNIFIELEERDLIKKEVQSLENKAKASRKKQYKTGNTTKSEKTKQ